MRNPIYNTKIFSAILLLCYLLIPQASLAQGLKFYGSAQPIDKRTSYNVFDKITPELSDRFDIEFDLTLYPETQIGYIIRIKNKDDKIIYNLFYDGQGTNILFKFNKEGHNSLITAEMDRKEMTDANWFKMKIAFDLKNDSLTLTIHNRTFALGEIDLPDKYRPTIVFGKSDYIIDVPTVAIKNLTVGDGKNHFFALHESEGNVVHDEKGRSIGSVSNPEWLINDSYHWKFETSFSSKTVAGTIYNPEKKEIYYFNRDHINIYNVWSKEITKRDFANRCPVDLALGTNFINTDNHNLYAYEVYDESANDCVTMASLDMNDYRWSTESNEQLPTQLHHHGAFFDAVKGKYTIFGGFGNMRYSNKIYSFDVNSKRWEQLIGLEGNVPSPRYFSSVGYLEKNNSIYIFGGMGNESGEQEVGRNYFYDLHKIDLTTKQATKLWEINSVKINMVPVRGMIFLDDSHFYTLCYPESMSDSYLLLYRFSLKDGSYKILGDSIPIHSDKITTNANLYYDPQINNLYVTVQEFEDDIESELKVYSLSFPPITADELINYSGNHRQGAGLLILSVLCILAIVISYILLRKRRLKNAREEVARLDKQSWQHSAEPIKANSMYLFGDFMVRDRNSKDITYMFSTRLKQTLCLILQYSNDEGISSQLLSNLLWPDKPGDKVKNSRSVTINHLRKTLSELDGVELIYEKGCFKIVQSDAFYCDYIRCIELLSTNVDKDKTDELIRIIMRGKFLKLSNEPLFDSMKEKLEHMLEPILHAEMDKSFVAEDYHNTIKLALAEFNIDPLNDEALAFQIKALLKLKMTEEARIKYHDFVRQYKNTIGSDYPHPLKSF